MPGRTSENKSDNEREHREREIQEWKQQWAIHNRMIQRIEDPVGRWDYICDKVENCGMCDRIMIHCEKIGIEIKKPNINWARLIKGGNRLNFQGRY